MIDLDTMARHVRDALTDSEELENGDNIMPAHHARRLLADFEAWDEADDAKAGRVDAILHGAEGMAEARKHGADSFGGIDLAAAAPKAADTASAAKYADMDIAERAVAMADDGEGDPWELLGYFREKLRQSEANAEAAKTAAVDLALRLRDARAAAPKAASEEGATGLLRDIIAAEEAGEGWGDVYKRVKAFLAASPTDATGAGVMRERCAKVCEDQAASFLSPQYATGQPLSSFQERFACQQCAAALRSRAHLIKQEVAHD